MKERAMKEGNIKARVKAAVVRSDILSAFCRRAVAGEGGEFGGGRILKKKKKKKKTKRALLSLLVNTVWQTGISQVS